MQQLRAVLLSAVHQRDVLFPDRRRLVLPGRRTLRKLERLLLGDMSGGRLRRLDSAVQTERQLVFGLERLLLSELPIRPLREHSLIAAGCAFGA